MDCRALGRHLESTTYCCGFATQSTREVPIKVSQRAEYAVLARLLVAAREQARLSQSELARRLRRPQVFIWRIETAQQSPDLVEILDLAAVTGADFVTLVTAFRDAARDLPKG